MKAMSHRHRDEPPMSIVLTPFARLRLFPRVGRATAIRDCTAEQFERRLNDAAPLRVLPGYAPFCRLHVHRNWTSTRCLVVPVNDANRQRLRSAYEARTKDELPVLVRWFEGVDPVSYTHLDVYKRQPPTAPRASTGRVGRARKCMSGCG